MSGTEKVAEAFIKLSPGRCRVSKRRGDMLLASQLFSPTQLEYSRRDLLRLPTLARLGYSYYAPGRQLSKKERPHQSAIGEAEIDPQLPSPVTDLLHRNAVLAS